jgi:cytolysin-activating lysine-acyltransferase
MKPAMNRNNFKPGLLVNAPPHKLHQLIGEITLLMMVSKVHRKMQIRDIADIVLPFINLDQFMIYRNGVKRPVAFITWAYFSEEVEKEYLNGKAVLSEKELNSGKIIYMTDFIAPYGHAKRIIKELRTSIFPHAEVKALRLTEQGERRKKLWKFHGINYKQKLN